MDADNAKHIVATYMNLAQSDINAANEFIQSTNSICALKLHNLTCNDPWKLWSKATRIKNTAVLQKLLDLGLPLQMDDHHICDAAANGDLSSVRWFHEHGVCVNVAHYHGACLSRVLGQRNPLKAAASKGHLHVIEYLVEIAQATDYVGAMLWAAYYNHRSIVEYFLGRGVDINATDSPDNNTALHAAADAGHVSMVQHLLDRGANFLTKNRYGVTSEEMTGGYGECDKLLQKLRKDHEAKEWADYCNNAEQTVRRIALSTAHALVPHIESGLISVSLFALMFIINTYFESGILASIGYSIMFSAILSTLIFCVCLLTSVQYVRVAVPVVPKDDIKVVPTDGKA